MTDPRDGTHPLRIQKTLWDRIADQHPFPIGYGDGMTDHDDGTVTLRIADDVYERLRARTGVLAPTPEQLERALLEALAPNEVLN